MRTDTTGVVVVIGSGVAGLSAAIAAARSAPTILLSDRAIGRSNSAVAQGGLQVPVPTDRSYAAMAGDIRRSAREPVPAARIDSFVRGIGPAFERLEEWGMHFDRSDDGALVRSLAGGLTEPRVVSAGDHIGGTLIKTLRHTASAEPDLDIRPWSTVRTLTSGSDGTVALSVESRSDGAYEIRTRALVIGTGGTAYQTAQRHGELTSNPVNENSTLSDALLALGLETEHPQRFQLHPFGVLESEDRLVVRCVPERIVSLGVRIVDDAGRPVAGHSSDRHAIVEGFESASRAGRFDGHGARAAARLTLGDVPWADVERDFPAFARWANTHDLAAKDLLVAPALHYQLGGFRVGESGSTRHPSVFLAGEVASSVHGQNRLMGLGIADALTHGWAAGEGAARRATNPDG